MAEEQEHQGQPQEPESQDSKQEPAKPAATKPTWQPKSKASRADRAAMADRLYGKEPKAEADDKAAAKAPKAKTPADDASPAETDSSATASSATKGDDSTDLKGAIAALLKQGDLGAIAEKVGVDRKHADASSAKLRIARKSAEEADAKLTEAKDLKARAQKEFGAPYKAREAYDKGDFHEAAEWISHVLGEDFAAVTRNIANATKGMDETQLKRFQKERELKAREKALEEKERATERKVTEEQREGRAIKAVVAKCAGHDALKLKGGDRLVMQKLEAAFDPQKGTIGIGYKQAADQVLEEFLENAKALGLSRGDAPKPTAATPPKAPEPARGRREFPTESGSAKPSEGKARGLSFEERRARAERQYEKGRP